MADLRPVQGLFYEDYSIGASITSQGRTVTESDIVSFAMLSGDWNPLHTDAQAAKETPYGERIAHGMLVLSMATGLAERLGFLNQTVLGFMGLNWQFRAAVKIGDTIRVQATVSELKPMPRLGGGYVTFKVQILNQEDKAVQRGEWVMLIKNKEG